MTTLVHEELIKTFLLKCKAAETKDTIWNRLPLTLPPNPTMVGFYPTTNNPAGLPSPTGLTSQLHPILEDPVNGGATVKRLVCSPDLPTIATYPSPPQSGSESSRDFVCVLCNKVLPNKTAFFNHQKCHQQQATQPHVKENEDAYKCNICGKTFAVPARLTRHYRTHTGEKPFRCEFCSKSFSVKENLSVHRRIHTKERPYKCEVCSRAFEHSGKLHRHMRIHTGERPHKCSVCAKTFIQSGQLVIHMRTHTGEKPYVCGVCQKGFTCSKQLKVHSRTHTGEKPYSCEICGKSFGYNHVLKLHQVAHYGEKVYKCTICNDTFNSKKTMESHIKSHSENCPVVVPASPPQSTSPSIESLCSSASDKENRDSDDGSERFLSLNQRSPQSDAGNGADPLGFDQEDIKYYLYPTARERLSPTNFTYFQHQNPSSGVELLAAAATERAREDQLCSTNQDMAVINLISRTTSQEVMTALRQHTAYLVPAAHIMATHQHHNSHQLPQSMSLQQPLLPANQFIDAMPLNAADDIRKRVEAALAGTEQQESMLITPPSSNPVSPAPSLSPPPIVSVAVKPDPELSLPPRKRSKMILKSMELTMEATTATDLSPVRYSSVIKFAGSS